MNLDQIDPDGAVRETAHEAIESLPAGDTRLDFLKKAGLAGGAVVGGGALLTALTPCSGDGGGQGPAAGEVRQGRHRHPQLRPHPRVPRGRLLQRASANQKSKSFIKDAQAQVFLKTVTADENAHVAFLKKALGKKAIGAPKVDFGSTTSDEASFIKTAVALENTGVHAYSGQALNIADPAYVAAALSILTVEARHASVAGLLLTGKPSGLAPDGPFDKPFTAGKVLKAVNAIGFLE
jgi:hypothetical protein